MKKGLLVASTLLVLVLKGCGKTEIFSTPEIILENEIVSTNEIVSEKEVSSNVVVSTNEVVKAEPITTVYDIPYKNHEFGENFKPWNPGTLTVIEDNGVFIHLAVYDDGDQWFQPVTISWEASFNMSGYQKISGYALKLGDVNDDTYEIEWLWAGKEYADNKVVNQSEEFLSIRTGASKIWDIVRLEESKQDIVYFKYVGNDLLNEQSGYSQEGMCAYIVNKTLNEVVCFTAFNIKGNVTDWAALESVVKSVKFIDSKIMDSSLENPPMNKPAK
ncbi:MAG TPA: hypothetical protein VJZ04_12085 [Lachnospiraceae bacterium]|nr:hypothetical protein [Lachnospiraceae bacterium]